MGKCIEMTTIDKILLGLVGFLIGFIITIIILFCIFQSVPDTLVECVFSLAGGEGVITFAIWWIKKKHVKNVSKSCQEGEKNNDIKRKTDK